MFCRHEVLAHDATCYIVIVITSTSGEVLCAFFLSLCNNMAKNVTCHDSVFGTRPFRLTVNELCCSPPCILGLVSKTGKNNSSGNTHTSEARCLFSKMIFRIKFSRFSSFTKFEILVHCPSLWALHYKAVLLFKILLKFETRASLRIFDEFFVGQN